MAQGVGSSHGTKLGQDTFGGHFFGAVDYSGSKSYVAGGDSIDSHAFGFPNSIITLIGSVDQTDTYFTIGRPLQNGITPYQLVWYLCTTGAEVAAGTNLSGVTVRLSAIGI